MMTPGKTYRCSNPFVFSGIGSFWWEANNAYWMNNRPVLVTGFHVNYQTLAFGDPFLPNGAQPYTGGIGVRLAHQVGCSRHLSRIELASGVCPLGRPRIYGFDRIGIQGFPAGADILRIQQRDLDSRRPGRHAVGRRPPTNTTRNGRRWPRPVAPGRP